MKIIKDVFDPAKKIDRRIEKVITYKITDDSQLKNEIREYVVTESIAGSLEYLLDNFERGMEGDPLHEVGIWVSGFYGSGKSSFTKYLGFAWYDTVTVEDQPFLKLLQNQVTSKPLRQRLAAAAKRYPAAVIMLDLASEQLAGASMKEISTVLYSKVLQWAGYSKDIKIAYLEFMLEKDGKLEQFKERIKQVSAGKSWEEMRNQPLVIKTKASQLAVEFYPGIWKDRQSFNEIKIEELVHENDRVRDMIDMIRRRKGKENIIIILDEVGQYVMSRDDLILNLDGLAKNIKALGRGRAWIIATAQQTLTEDDPHAVMNSAKLFKLKDRFPIQIELEAKDIKEICWRRLLEKSDQGDKLLQNMFQHSGDKLRYAIQLKNTRFYKSEIDKQQFCQLYPFLPQHFDILLQLLARLAKSSGGIGLRSAIKVIQDIMVDQSGLRPGSELLAHQPIGALATTVDIFDTLKRDILRSYRHLVESVEKVERIFSTHGMQTKAAKSIAVLQILEDFPVSEENIAALMHPFMDSRPLLPEVKNVVSQLLNETTIPISEVDGNLRFMSEAVSEIEKIRNEASPMSNDEREIKKSALSDAFSPLPTAVISGTKRVTCGLKFYFGSITAALSGEKEPIQLLIDFFPAEQYEDKKKEIILESQQRTNSANIFLIGKEDKKVNSLVVDIFRSRYIYRTYQHKTVEKEVADYLKSQDQLAEKRKKELINIFEKGLNSGSFIFRAKPRPAGELADHILEALKKFLAEAAREIYEKYSEAPVHIQGTVAEKFLKTEKLDRIRSDNDPLKLVDSHGNIKLEHKACISIKDYLERFGQVEGRKLLDDFFNPPFGWPKDTTRYIVAAMLVGGAVKLRISGEDITVRGEAAVQTLSKTIGFNRIGIALRDSAPSLDIIKKASDRLIKLLGVEVLPLEEDISKHVIKHFPDIQQEFASLPIQLKNLNLPGGDRVENLLTDIAEILKGDASDAPNRLGCQKCCLYDNVLWARQVIKAFNNGLDELVKNISGTVEQIQTLPDSGILSELIENSRDIIEQLKEYIRRENFFDFIAKMQSKLNDLGLIIKNAAAEYTKEQHAAIDKHIQAIQTKPDWTRLDTDGQVHLTDKMDALKIDVSKDIYGLKRLVNHEYTIKTTFENCGREIQRLIREKKKSEPHEKLEFTEVRVEPLPPEVTSAAEIDDIIQKLQEIKQQLQAYKRIKINWKL